jgi:glycosyltransferase involved in cell wall biosynthesis
MTLSVIIPTKNEAACIADVIQELEGVAAISEIIVVDGHSIDETVNIVRSMGYRVVVQPGAGYGDAVQEGVRHAVGDAIAFIDADGSYDPRELPDLLRLVAEQGHDVAFASRYAPGAGSDDDTWLRLVGNKLFTWLLRFFHGVQISDALFLYMVARRSVFQRTSVTSPGFEYCIEFPIKVHHAGLRYTEIPSRERPRIGGESKVRAFYHGWKIFVTVAREWLVRLLR